MTILDILNKKYEHNGLMKKASEIIKDNFINLVNDNYEIIINEKGELIVRIPSLEKRDEYVYKSINEYEYGLVMCMRISEVSKEGAYQYIIDKFMELYKDKLELLFKDITTVNTLLDKIKKTKNNIDNMTYASIGAVILVAISLCIFTQMPSILRSILILGMILFSIMSLAGQFTKENKVKKVIDAYISVIKTEWYKKQLQKEYAFLCNYEG